jgi:hypothetical protein
VTVQRLGKDSSVFFLLNTLLINVENFAGIGEVGQALGVLITTSRPWEAEGGLLPGRTGLSTGAKSWPGWLQNSFAAVFTPASSISTRTARIRRRRGCWPRHCRASASKTPTWPIAPSIMSGGLLEFAAFAVVRPCANWRCGSGLSFVSLAALRPPAISTLPEILRSRPQARRSQPIESKRCEAACKREVKLAGGQEPDEELASWL